MIAQRQQNSDKLWLIFCNFSTKDPPQQLRNSTERNGECFLRLQANLLKQALLSPHGCFRHAVAGQLSCYKNFDNQR